MTDSASRAAASSIAAKRGPIQNFVPVLDLDRTTMLHMRLPKQNDPFHFLDDHPFFYLTVTRTSQSNGDLRFTEYRAEILPDGNIALHPYRSERPVQQEDGSLLYEPNPRHDRLWRQDKTYLTPSEYSAPNGELEGLILAQGHALLAAYHQMQRGQKPNYQFAAPEKMPGRNGHYDAEVDDPDFRAALAATRRRITRASSPGIDHPDSHPLPDPKPTVEPLVPDQPFNPQTVPHTRLVVDAGRLTEAMRLNGITLLNGQRDMFMSAATGHVTIVTQTRNPTEPAHLYVGKKVSGSERFKRMARFAIIQDGDDCFATPMPHCETKADGSIRPASIHFHNMVGDELAAANQFATLVARDALKCWQHQYNAPVPAELQDLAAAARVLTRADIDGLHYGGQLSDKRRPLTATEEGTPKHAPVASLKDITDSTFITSPPPRGVFTSLVIATPPATARG